MVYLVPVGADRYELYCEVADGDDGQADAPRGWFRQRVQAMRELVRQAEPGLRRQAAAPDSAPASLVGRAMRRVRDLSVRWAAASIAEQRLLWHLRRQSDSRAVHPSDLDGEAAMRQVRGILQRDADRHLYWLIFDVVALVVSGVFVIVPGPNLIAYYFAFRVFGHYLSRRGARQGLQRVTWHPESSEPLRELREVVQQRPPDRHRRLRAIADRLGLERLAAFVERTVRPASRRDRARAESREPRANSR